MASNKELEKRIQILEGIILSKSNNDEEEESEEVSRNFTRSYDRPQGGYGNY